MRIAVNQHDDVCILFDGTRITKVRESRHTAFLVVRSIQLRQGNDWNL